MAPAATKPAEETVCAKISQELVHTRPLWLFTNLVESRVQPKEGPPELSDFGDNIDQATFEQILEMDDDDDDRDFSKGIVYGFFEQADGTFEKMEKAM